MSIDLVIVNLNWVRSRNCSTYIVLHLQLMYYTAKHAVYALVNPPGVSEDVAGCAILPIAAFNSQICLTQS